VNGATDASARIEASDIDRSVLAMTDDEAERALIEELRELGALSVQGGA
jgi:hypothetical protein